MSCKHRSSVRSIRAFLLCTVTAGAALAPSAWAQGARVYVANSANSRVLSVEFNPPSTQVVIDDTRLTDVRDIALRDGGLAGSSLLVCDRNGGQILFYPGVTGAGQVVYHKNSMAGPERPDGMSLDLAGNIFVMNSGQGSSGGVSQVWVIRRDENCPGQSWCLPGGYAAPLGLVDPDVYIHTVVNDLPAAIQAGLLPESLVVEASAGVFDAGDVLVLTEPAALLRYRASEVGAFLDALAMGQTPAPLTPETIVHPAGASVPADRQFPAGAQVGGMAFAPGGELLIASQSGRVFRYGVDGHRRSDGSGGFSDFAAGSGGSDEYKIAVGLQDAVMRAFVTRQAKGELLRYSFNNDGTGSLDSTVAGMQKPVGVGASNSNAVSAPAGSDVIVEPTSVMASRLELVLGAGVVSGKVSVFPDPREGEMSIPSDQPLHRPLLLSELRADLPPVEIPAWARAFPLGDPQTGTPSFILLEAESSAVVEGVLDHLAVEEPILGYAVDCDDPDPTRQPYLFWSPDANDPPIVEGELFIDITTGCGTIRGLTRGMSYFLVGVRITQPLPAVVSDKLRGLRDTISGSACIKAQTSRKLLLQLSRAERDLGRGNYPKVLEALQQIELIVEGSAQDFSSCGDNIAGEIRARTRSAIFMTGKL